MKFHLEIPQPPQLCETRIADATTDQGTELECGTMITWKGEMIIRSCPDKYPLYKLYWRDESFWTEACHFDFITRYGDPASLSEAMKQRQKND